jgi:hypothetical protein
MDDIRKRLVLFKAYLTSRKRHHETMLSVMEVAPGINLPEIENHHLLLDYIDDIINDFDVIVNSENLEEPS